jgi:hypothetical protein
LFLYAEKEPTKYERAALRWPALKAQLALSALAELRAGGSAAPFGVRRITPHRRVKTGGRVSVSRVRAPVDEARLVLAELGEEAETFALPPDDRKAGPVALFEPEHDQLAVR